MTPSPSDLTIVVCFQGADSHKQEIGRWDVLTLAKQLQPPGVPPLSLRKRYQKSMEITGDGGRQRESTLKQGFAGALSGQWRCQRYK